MVDVSGKVRRCGVMAPRRRSDVSEVVGRCVFVGTRRPEWKWWLIEGFVLIGWRLEQNEKANTHRRKREKHITIS